MKDNKRLHKIIRRRKILNSISILFVISGLLFMLGTAGASDCNLIILPY